MINRKDMYNDYSDKHIPYLYHTIFNRDVNASFEWGCGDTTTLYFNFEFDKFDQNPTWEGKTMEISICNFRYEEMFKTEVEGGSNISVFIDEETSKLFASNSTSSNASLTSFALIFIVRWLIFVSVSILILQFIVIGLKLFMFPK